MTPSRCSDPSLVSTHIFHHSNTGSDREDVPGIIHLPEEAMVAEEKAGSKSAGLEQPPDPNSRNEESIESPDQMREPTSDSDKPESSKAYFDCASGKSCENHRLKRQHIAESFSVVNRDRRIPASHCRREIGRFPYGDYTRRYTAYRSYMPPRCPMGIDKCPFDPGGYLSLAILGFALYF
jgi:hypothetical protein